MISEDEDQVLLAFAKLKEQKARLSSSFDLIQGLTLADLRQSKNLRTLILDYDLNWFV